MVGVPWWACALLLGGMWARADAASLGLEGKKMSKAAMVEQMADAGWNRAELGTWTKARLMAAVRADGERGGEEARANTARERRTNARRGKRRRRTPAYPAFARVSGPKRGSLARSRCSANPKAVLDEPANAAQRILGCDKDRGVGDDPVATVILVDPTDARAAAALAHALGSKLRRAVEFLVLFNVKRTHSKSISTASSPSSDAHFRRFREALPAEQHVLVYASPPVGLAGAYNRLVLASNAAVCVLAGAGPRSREAADVSELTDFVVEAVEKMHRALGLGAVFPGGGGGGVAVRREAMLEFGGFSGGGCETAAERTCAHPLERELDEGMRGAGWVVARLGTANVALRPHGACPDDVAPTSAWDGTDAPEFLEEPHNMMPKCGILPSLTTKELENRLQGSCQPRWGIALQYYRRAAALSELAAPLASHGDALEVLVHNDGASEHAAWVAALAGVAKHGGRTWLVHSANVHEIRGYNRLARLSAAELLAFVQDDDVPRKLSKTLDEAVSLFARYPGLALLGGWRGRIDDDRAPFNARTNQPDGRKYGPGLMDIPTWDEGAGVPFMFAARVNAAPLFARRRTFLQLGGFRTDLSCPGEAGIGFDFEYSLRSWFYGYQVGLFYARYRHNAAAEAKESGTRANASAWFRRKEQERMNNRRLYELFPGFYHAKASRLAEDANRKLMVKNYDVGAYVHAGDFSRWTNKFKE